MNPALDLETLLLRWSDGTLSREEFEELKTHLKSPTGRARMVEDALINEAILDAFASQKAFATIDAKLQSTRRPSILRLPKIVHSGLRETLCSPQFLALAAGFALLGTIAFLLVRPSPLQAYVAKADAMVEVVRDGRSLPANTGLKLKGADIIRTRTGSAVVSFAGESTWLEVKPATELRFAGSRQGKRLELLRGTINAVVAHQSSKKPMRIMTARAEAVVLGTKFALTAKPASTWLQVHEGAVQLVRRPDEASIKVGAGQFAVAVAGVDLAARAETRGTNLVVPIAINLFYQYKEGEWPIRNGIIQQTEVRSAHRLFGIGPVEEECVVQTTVTVDAIPQRDRSWGYGMDICFADGELIYFRCVQEPGGFSRLYLEPRSSAKASKAVPFQHPPRASCHVKIKISRTNTGRAFIAARVWPIAAEEPTEDMVVLDAVTVSPLKAVALVTHESACTFRDLQARLVE